MIVAQMELIFKIRVIARGTKEKSPAALLICKALLLTV
jgi:hypothetical protein